MPRWNRLPTRFALMVALVALGLFGFRWVTALSQVQALETSLRAGTQSSARGAERRLVTPGSVPLDVLTQLREDDARLHAVELRGIDGRIEARAAAAALPALPALPALETGQGWHRPATSTWLPVPPWYVLDRRLADGRSLRLVVDAGALREAWLAMILPALAVLATMGLVVAAIFGWLLARPLRALREATEFAQALPRADGSGLAPTSSHLTQIDTLRNALSQAASLVTQQRDALALERQRLRAVLDADDAQISLKDRDGRFVLVNASFLRLWRLDESSVIGRTSIEVFGDAPGVLASQAFDRQAWELDAAHEVEQCLRLDGDIVDFAVTRRTVDAPGGQRLLMAVARDISALRRHTRALAYQQAFASSVIDLVDHGIVVKDAQLRYVLVNQAYARATGRDKAELLGRTPYELFDRPAMIDRVLDADRRALDQGLDLTRDDGQCDERGPPRLPGGRDERLRRQAHRPGRTRTGDRKLHRRRNPPADARHGIVVARSPTMIALRWQGILARPAMPARR